MNRLFSTLRDKRGMTLIEMVVGAGLLCVVIGIFSASLRPAAEVTRRTQELNSAELIADDLLETVRSEIETASGYIKCYENGTDIIGKEGETSGTAIEFVNEKDFVELISTDGCEETRLVGNQGGGTAKAIEAGRLIIRYYRTRSDNTYEYADAAGSPIARGVANVFPTGFYMKLTAGLSFSIDDTAHTVTATADIYRGETKLFTDSQVIDLRYKPPFKADRTATQKS